MPDDGVDTALARALHTVGAAPLDTLRVCLDEVRVRRGRGEPLTLAELVRARSLVPEETLASALASSSREGLALAASWDTSLPRADVDPTDTAVVLEPSRSARSPAFVASWEQDTSSPRGPAGPAPSVARTQLGPYRVVRPLAKGGMGAVLEVEREGSRYAAKVLLPGAGAEERRRLRAEGELLARLDHPNVVRVHSASLEGQDPWLVVDLLPGGSLDERLKTGGPLGSRPAAEVVLRLARAVEHAHSRGVLHRDLKPHNVLFDDRGEPCLVDFGVARALDAERMTRTGETMGTPAYMAPEQALDAKSVDHRADVYGLGAILYACLAGRAPFSGPSALQVLQKVCAQDPTPPSAFAPDVHPALEALCLRAMVRPLEQRTPSAVDLACALEAWLAAAAPASPPLARRRAAALAIVGLAAVGCAALAVAVANRARAHAVDRSTHLASLDPCPIATPPTPVRDPRGPDPVASAAPPRPALRTPASFEALSVADRPPLPLPAALRFTDQSGWYEATRDPTVVLVWVPRPPGGVVHLRGWKGTREGDESAAPPRDVSVPTGFFIGRTEVTCSQFERRLPNRAPNPARTRPDTDDFAEMNLAWADARDVCDALGLRLPSEAEWELAALGPDPARRFPWGNAPPDPEMGSFFIPGPVDAYPAGASPVGCLEMLGNAREWLSDPARAFGVEARLSRGSSSTNGLDLDPERRWVEAIVGQGNTCIGVRVACSP